MTTNTYTSARKIKQYYQPDYATGGQNGKFLLRDNLYRRIIYIIRDYDYFKATLDSENTEMHKSMWLPYDNASTVEKEAIDKNNFRHYVDAIDLARKSIPDYLADDVFDHVAYGKKYISCNFIHEQTMKKWTQRFIWYVAFNLGEV